MDKGVIYIYGPTQPTDPDAVASSTLLTEISVSSGDFAHGTTTNGLEFGAASNGTITKSATAVWSGVGKATGTATWFRFCANSADSEPGDPGATRISFDGLVTTSGGQLNMSSTAITAGATTTVDSFTWVEPAS
jgi:hypothetical protein